VKHQEKLSQMSLLYFYYIFYHAQSRTSKKIFTMELSPEQKKKKHSKIKIENGLLLLFFHLLFFLSRPTEDEQANIYNGVIT